MAVATHSRKWTDAYSRGQSVECWLPFADGARWVQCTVVMRTRSGLPVVTVDGGSKGDSYRIDRMTEIRTVRS